MQNFETPRPLYRRRWVMGLGALVAALAVFVPVAWASDLFGDVPNTNPFHDDIGAIARAGITKGCDASTPPNYCPAANVTREAMAAFMHRGFGRVAFFSASTAVTVPASETSLWTATITPGLPTGALAGATGFVKGDAEIIITQNDATGCPCRYRAALFLTGEGYLDAQRYSEVTLTNAGNVATIPVTGARGVTTAGQKTVEIRVFRAGGGSGSVNASVAANLTLSYYPFGSTGTNTLVLVSGGGK